MAFDGGDVPNEHKKGMLELMAGIVAMLQDTIDIIDFWKKPIEVKKLRGNIDTQILLSQIPQLIAKHERVAMEIVKLAEKRDKELRK